MGRGANNHVVGSPRSRSQSTSNSRQNPASVVLGPLGVPAWGASHFLASCPRKSVARRRPQLAHGAEVDVAALLRSLASKQGRKYSLDSVKMSLEAILQQGVSTTQASEMYGINRSTLQFYLKKLNVVRRRWKQPPAANATATAASASATSSSGQ